MNKMKWLFGLLMVVAMVAMMGCEPTTGGTDDTVTPVVPDYSTEAKAVVENLVAVVGSETYTVSGDGDSISDGTTTYTLTSAPSKTKAAYKNAEATTFIGIDATTATDVKVFVSSSLDSLWNAAETAVIDYEPAFVAKVKGKVFASGENGMAMTLAFNADGDKLATVVVKNHYVTYDLASKYTTTLNEATSASSATWTIVSAMGGADTEGEFEIVDGEIVLKSAFSFLSAGDILVPYTVPVFTDAAKATNTAFLGKLGSKYSKNDTAMGGMGVGFEWDMVGFTMNMHVPYTAESAGTYHFVRANSETEGVLAGTGMDGSISEYTVRLTLDAEGNAATDATFMGWDLPFGTKPVDAYVAPSGH